MADGGWRVEDGEPWGFETCRSESLVGRGEESYATQCHSAEARARFPNCSRSGGGKLTKPAVLWPSNLLVAQALSPSLLPPAQVSHPNTRETPPHVGINLDNASQRWVLCNPADRAAERFASSEDAGVL